MGSPAADQRVAAGPARPGMWPAGVAARRAWLVARPVGTAILIVPLGIFLVAVLVMLGFLYVWFARIIGVVVGGSSQALWNTVTPDRWHVPDGILPAVVAVVALLILTVPNLWYSWPGWRHIGTTMAAPIAAWRQAWIDAAQWPPPPPEPSQPRPPTPRPVRRIRTRPAPAAKPTRRPPARVRSTTPIVADRAWTVTLEDPVNGLPVLQAVTSGTRWPGTALTAACNRDMGHPAPDPDCSCGVYALKPGVPLPLYALRGVTVAGTVELSGRVIEATRGYRAEHARIVGPLQLSSVRCDEAVSEIAFDALTIGARLELRYGITIDLRGGSDEHW